MSGLASAAGSGLAWELGLGLELELARESESGWALESAPVTGRARG